MVPLVHATREIAVRHARWRTWAHPTSSVDRALVRDAAAIQRPDHRISRVRFPPPPPIFSNDIGLLRMVRAAHPRPKWVGSLATW